MKAEERHRLETNTLADRIGGWADRAKHGDRAIIRVAVVVVLAGLALFVWRYVAGSRAADTASTWMTLEGANNVPALEEFVSNHKDTTAARIARLHEARIWLGPLGIEALQEKDADRRKKAAGNIEKARDEFAKLAGEFTDVTLRTQSLVGVAKAEEALVGLKDGNPQDQVKKAAEAYDKVAQAAPGTSVSDAAKAYADQLRGKANEVVKVQTTLNTLMTPPAPALPPSGPAAGVPSLPGFPGLAPADPKPPVMPGVNPAPVPPTPVPPPAKEVPIPPALAPVVPPKPDLPKGNAPAAAAPTPPAPVAPPAPPATGKK